MRLLGRVLVAGMATLCVAGCGEDDAPTGPSSAMRAVKPAGGLKVTPGQLNLSGVGVKASLSASSAAGGIAVAVSSPACVAVSLKSAQQNQSRYNVTAIAAGSCAITVTDAGTGNVQVPVQVASTLVRTTLTAGIFHTCGLDNAGAAWCWGLNASGQLGNSNTVGSHTPNPTPEQVGGGITFASLTGGGDHTCGLTPAGLAYCWGDNRWGQLGNTTNAGVELGQNPSPLAVEGNLTFSALEAGGNHTCGITTQGVMYCWGFNWYGQLGTTTNNGQNDPNPAPAPVGGSLTFTALGAGTDHTCGVAAGGAVYCWGDNSKGQLGSTEGLGDPIAAHPTPTQVPGVSLASLAAGGHYNCGLTSAGAAWCWGDNHFGELSGSTDEVSPTPVAVSGGVSFIALGSGGGHSCGLTSASAVYCWGGNLLGGLGTTTNYQTTTPTYTPSQVSGVSFAVLAVNAAHTCGLTAAGAAWCWGYNEYGQTGTTPVFPPGASPTPQAVVGGVTFATE